MLNKFEVEDMTYLADTFPMKLGADGEQLHPAQKAGRQINMKLLFAVPHPATVKNSSTDESLPWTSNPSLAYVKDEPVRIISVSVPRGLPIYRIRHLIKHLENELRSTYSDCKRLNIVLTREEGGEAWDYSFDLPTYGVAYV